MTGKQRTVRRQLFPEKLWDLVNRPASGIQWAPDGKRIEVERAQLEKYIGTKFRSQNFDSFIRQLHFYGFRKSGNFYHHNKFQRGQPEALLTMKRKYSNLSSLCSNTDNNNNNNNNNLNDSQVSPFHTSNASSTSTNDSYTKCQTTNNCNAISSALDLSNLASHSSTQSTSSTDTEPYSAIDYSKSNRKIGNIAPKMASSRAIVRTNSRVEDESKEITLYALKPTGSTSSSESSIKVNTSISRFCDNNLKTSTRGSSIQINIPEALKSSDGNWPKTLVLDSYWSGGQTLVSAYFIYKLDASHGH